jgi:hypothetical protein
VSPVEPNHSVNLTRNSVPHLPGMARYAHNALPGKRVTPLCQYDLLHLPQPI